MGKTNAFRRKIQSKPLKLMTLSYIVVIAIGTVLLALPIATNSGEPTPLFNSFFTSTSATCVIGLEIYNTYGYWSFFGQAVILALIQIGGLGLVSFTTFLTLTMRKKLGFRDLQLGREYIGADGLMHVPKILRLIVTLTVVFELIGACILSIRFIPQFGLSGIWKAVFMSVSAYCNAGFDVLGKNDQNMSMINYAHDPLVIFTIAALIILGGIGFIVINDLLSYKKNKRLMLHTKIVLLVSAVLIAAGMVAFMVFEYNNDKTIGNQGFFTKLMSSFFQSVTTRTAGFTTVNIDSVTDPTKLFICALMFIGGSPGSTCGGIKTTTFAVLIITVVSVIRGRRDATVFNRRIDKSIVYKSFTITILVLCVTIITFFVIFFTTDSNNITTMDCLAEAIAASATGLSFGITKDIGIWSRIAVIITMFIGRVGPVTLVYSLTRGEDNSTKILPEGKIIVG